MSMVRGLIGGLLAVLLSTSAFAQSQAANGSIEGTVTDVSGGVLPGVTVTITNTDTGTERIGHDEHRWTVSGAAPAARTVSGGRRAPGIQEVRADRHRASGRPDGPVNVTLQVGAVSETITVTAESPIAQPGKIDLGRTIGETEIHNLPLPSRNPYNFAFLQANVTGYENNEFGVPRINANGSQMHTNYQLDGNTNTEKDRAGLRLLPISEVLVREVKVVTNGFAPEFGQTTGMVYNAITQSGTNDLHGSASYRFKRNAMSARTFFLAPTARKPDTEADDATATLGGPIARDKRALLRRLRVRRPQPDHRRQGHHGQTCGCQALGITLPDSGVIPAHQKVNFAFGKVDYQVGQSTLVTGRYLLFKNFSLSNIGGGLTTTDRATDFTDRMDSASVQAVSTLGTSQLNEFRVQFAQAASVPHAGHRVSPDRRSR